jgi:hypothetical protein
MNTNENVEYGEKEIKLVEENVNEILNISKDSPMVNSKVKINKIDKFSKEEALKEGLV